MLFQFIPYTVKIPFYFNDRFSSCNAALEICTNRFSHLQILMVFFHIIISYSKRKKQAQQLASSYMLFHSIAFCITFGFVSYERILLIPILLFHLFIPLDAFDQITKRKKNMVERNVHFIFSNNSLRNCL